MKVLVVFGTRPEAVKLAPVIKALLRRKSDIECRVWLTGQHRELVNQVLECFGIQPHENFGLMSEGQTPTRLAASILVRLEPVISSERPDWIVVQGDTTSALAGALAGFYGAVPVAHVEAGLRTYDLAQPFPEEGNRRMIGSIASLHLAPTARARRNLLEEAVPQDRIVVTGNPIVDALRSIADLRSDWPSELAGVDSRVRLLLTTIHRRESFGAPLRSICRALNEISVRYAGGVHVVVPVHPNPEVGHVVREELGGARGVSLIRPLDYVAFIGLLKRCHAVLTDSGGVQEEAPSLGKPVLVLRNKTERPEMIEAGCGRLIGTGCEDIVAEVSRLLDDGDAYRKAARPIDVYGDGKAAERIVEALLRR